MSKTACTRCEPSVYNTTVSKGTPRSENEEPNSAKKASERSSTRECRQTTFPKTGQQRSCGQQCHPFVSGRG
eukprot:1772409-Amphidinium_carterae.1